MAKDSTRPGPTAERDVALRPAFDLRIAAGVLLGAVLALALPMRTPWPIAASLAFLAAVWFGCRPRWRWAGALLFGVGWTALHADVAMHARLPHALEGRDLVVRGRVVGLPVEAPGQLRFDFLVDGADENALTGRMLRLGWYRSDAVVAPGSRWQLEVRLRRPRGGVNPGGFDYERHALERRLAATGYVRPSSSNQMLDDGGGIHARRADLSRAIADAADAPRARFVQALAVGDTRALDEHDWEVLRATGIAHLIAISGLHVGLVAGFGALLARLAYRCVPRIGLRLPLPQSAALAALLFSAGYTALAGFALPTVRTLLMIAAALAAVLLRRAFVSSQALALALVAMLLVDPLSVLNAGFWLSFLGVGWLMLCLPQAWQQSPLRALLSAQGVSTLGLLPLTVWFFGQASVAGPVANLAAVPWVSFVVVPVALAGTGMELLHAGWGAGLFALSAWLMQGLWNLLEPLADLRGALVYLPDATTAALVLSLLGALWLLLPRGLPGKPLALLLFAPLLLPADTRPPPGEADLHLLDVGQGLSVVVRTHRHTLLYDAGPALSGGLDAGAATVVPALRGLGVRALDVLLVSHADNDHAGGAPAVVRAFRPARRLASRDQPLPGETECRAGERWIWDGVTFELLHPPPLFPYFGNESSCVLRIRSAAGAVALLPGDITATIEARLMREHPDTLDADVLIVPHHGSTTSSSPAFLDAVTPRLALVASGHRNRFGFPRAQILERFRRRNVPVHDTGHEGALHVRLGEDARLLERRRLDRPRPWREGGAASGP